MKIDGLTIEQVKMCDRLWSMNSQEELEQFIIGLGAGDKQMAGTLIDIIVYESIEEQIASMDYYPTAERLLQNISTLK